MARSISTSDNAVVVHYEHMEVSRSTSELPAPSPRIAALLRAGVEQVIDAPPEWIDALNRATLRGAGLEEVSLGEDLVAIAVRNNLSNLLLWAESNLENPGARVPARLTEDAEVLVHELVRRGLDTGAVDSFRTAQDTAWRHWMEICFTLTDDPAELRELLQVSSLSITTFIDDSVRLMNARVTAARHRLSAGTHAQRRAAAALVLEGAPIADDRASEQLGYRLSGPHCAAVISCAPNVPAEQMETVGEAIMTASGLPRRLTVLSGADENWVWFPGRVHSVPEVLRSHPGVTVALGSADEDREGFRRSHFQALTTHRLLTGGGSRRHARYEDVRLLDAMSDDAGRLDDFLSETLGDLRSAPPELAESLRVWFAAHCNASVAAQRLYTHRNTVVRRLEKARELLPIDLDEQPIAVAAALEVHHWRGGAAG